MCGPRYLSGRTAPGEPAALHRETLLHMDSAHASWLSWDDWLARCGASPSGKLPGPHFNNYGIATQAACEGQGLALGWRRLIEPELLAGTLVRVTDARVVPEDAYYLLVPERLSGDPRVRAFREWIAAEAAADWS